MEVVGVEPTSPSLQSSVAWPRTCTPSRMDLTRVELATAGLPAQLAPNGMQALERMDQARVELASASLRTTLAPTVHAGPVEPGWLLGHVEAAPSPR